LSRIHEIVLIPSAGHLGPGVYTRGHTVDAMAEVDLVDQYLRSLVDELDQSSIRYRVVPTRKGPGVAPERRYDGVAEANALPILCGIGWDKSVNKSAGTNTSAVRFAGGVSSALAAGLVETMAHWGALYVHGHRRSTPVQDESMRGGLIIEPFRLNGPDAVQYAARLDKLGRDLGRFIADYCLGKNTGTAIRAPSLLRRVQ
jgi:hypothetical protein